MADAAAAIADRTDGGIKLQVADARQEESGTGFARISRETMGRLGIVEGDIVEIEGKRATAARAILPHPEDEGIEVVRLDGLQRANAEVARGENVIVRKAEAKAAQRVVFAPAQRELRLQGPAQALKRNFFGRPFVAGDLVATAGQQQAAHKRPVDLQGVHWQLVQVAQRRIARAEVVEIDLHAEIAQLAQHFRRDIRAVHQRRLGDLDPQIRGLQP